MENTKDKEINNNRADNNKNEKEIKQILRTYKNNIQYKNELKAEFSLEKDKKRKYVLANEINKISELTNKTESIISNLAEPSKSILYLKFIKNESYLFISFKLHYSLQRIYQLLNIAVVEFKERFNSFEAENQPK